MYTRYLHVWLLNVKRRSKHAAFCGELLRLESFDTPLFLLLYYMYFYLQHDTDGKSSSNILDIYLNFCWSKAKLNIDILLFIVCNVFVNLFHKPVTFYFNTVLAFYLGVTILIHLPYFLYFNLNESYVSYIIAKYFYIVQKAF